MAGSVTLKKSTMSLSIIMFGRRLFMRKATRTGREISLSSPRLALIAWVPGQAKFETVARTH